MNRTLRWIGMALLGAVWGCSSAPDLAEFRQRLAAYPEYTVVLTDMEPDDSAHRYRVIHAKPGTEAAAEEFGEFDSGWVRVPAAYFSQHLDHLGMTILSKGPDGEVSEVAEPPGYSQVGNPSRGEWRNDSQGRSFWHYYGQYAFFSSMFGFGGRPVYRADWDTYRGQRTAGRPYFGSNNQFGTKGSYTKSTYKSFFDRRTAREARFADQLKGKVRRSNMSGVRSRSFGSGK